MTAPNRNTLWASILVDELVAGGVRSVCLAPGSRSTPLTVAFATHPNVETFSHLDERSAAFFALGRGRRMGTPTPIVCTSGTAAANVHPAVMEANEGSVPLLVLTADRPPELWESGANQTTDQVRLYGDAVRWYRSLPEPAPEPRTLRSLRVTVARALSSSTGTPPGPVHLNVPFRKPLEPTAVPDDVPTDLAVRAPEAMTGRDGPYVRSHGGIMHPDNGTVDAVAMRLDRATRGLLVCGPTAGSDLDPAVIVSLATATGFPILADPLSGLRFGSHVPERTDADGSARPTICGGYDSYLAGVDWPKPDVVIRFGASPTSKVLRQYLARTASTQFLIDPAGGWEEATFTATDHVTASPTPFVEGVLDRLGEQTVGETTVRYSERFATAEQRYWEVVDSERPDRDFEGSILREVCRRCPSPATLFVSNSMPVRDLDRFGQPRAGDITALGNRGVSGVDGIVSTALGAGSATDDPLVLVTGDIAYYHDMNGLLALDRCGVEATIVVIDNDGGGIFHMLPIEAFDPPFTEQFLTPHGLDFAPTGDLYDLDFERFDALDPFCEAFEASVERAGTQVLCLSVDGEASHRAREALHERVCESI